MGFSRSLPNLKTSEKFKRITKGTIVKVKALEVKKVAKATGGWKIYETAFFLVLCSFPLYGGRWLRGYIVHHPIYTLYLVYYPAHHMVQKLVG